MNRANLDAIKPNGWAPPDIVLAMVAELRAAREVVEAARGTSEQVRSGASAFTELAKLLVAIEVYDQAVAS